MNKSKALAGCVAGFSFACTITAVQAAPLQDELHLLQEHHPRIAATQDTAAGAREGVRQAFGAYLPTVNLTGDTGYEYIDSPARRDAGDSTYDGQRRTIGIVASQRLYDGGARSGTFDAAKLQHTLATTDMESVRQNVLFEGVQAYLTVLRQRDLVDLAAQNEETIRQQLNLEDERVRRGSGIAVDVLQAKSRLQLARERRVANEGVLLDALARYRQVFGRPAEMGAMTTPEPPLDAVPATLEEAIEIAVNENPAIRSAATQTAIAGEQREIARAGYLPTVNLEVSGNLERDKNAVADERRDYSILLKANWNLFNGFATRAGVARATYDQAASRNNQLFTTRKTEEQVQVAWHALDTARQRVALLENAVNIAEEVFASRQRLREAGTADAIAVLDAENELYGARINHTAALYDTRLAVYQMLLAMGRLSSPESAVATEIRGLALHRDN